eukprot:g23665.t1
MVCCFPGARLRDVSERLQNVLKGEGEQPEVIVHVGTNDMENDMTRKKMEAWLRRWQLGSRESLEVYRGYRSLLKKEIRRAKREHEIALAEKIR